jgi:YD repeat-containing protein
VTSPTCEVGSILECQNQTLGEAVPVTGTPFQLHYQSDRVAGRKTGNTLRIPVAGATIPASLQRIELEILVAGQRHGATLPAQPNQTYPFAWDGADAYGRSLSGPHPARIRIGYVYTGSYQQPAQLVRAFGYNGNGAIAGARTRQEVTLWQEQAGTVSAPGDAWSQGLGGWTPDTHHAYDPAGQALALGSGGRRGAADVGSVIRSVTTGAGWAVTVDGQGNPFFSSGHQIKKRAPDGTLTVVAGTGVQGFSGDGAAALLAQLSSPRALALDAQGNIFFADSGNHRIRRVAPDGIITTIAGTGTAGFGGDGGPPMRAQLNGPWAVAVDPQGDLFLADNGRIRKVAPTLPGFSSQDLAIPSADGRELYAFTAAGRHLRTLQALTGAVQYKFGYDGEDRLTTITDGDNNVTRIERDGSGAPTAIVAPDGQRTTLTVDGNGYLASIANPAGETHRFTYSPDGLMQTYTTPRTHQYTFTYDSLGRLSRYEDPATGSKTLGRTESGQQLYNHTHHRIESRDHLFRRGPHHGGHPPGGHRPRRHCHRAAHRHRRRPHHHGSGWDRHHAQARARPALRDAGPPPEFAHRSHA